MGVLSTEMMCPSDGCGTLMKRDLTRCRWRCSKKNCQNTLQIRGENRFFYYTESTGRRHSRLKLNEILEMQYFFLFTRMTVREAAYTTGHSQNTVIDWFNMMRKDCIRSIENQPKMVGTATNPVQIDESYFSRRRKYGRGRLMRGNLDENGTDEPRGELPGWNSEIPSSESFNIDNPS